MLIPLLLLVIQNTASVHGRVTNAVTGAPIAHAHVMMRDTDGDGFPAVTDAKGDYVASALPAGSFTGMASKSGFLSMTYSGAVKLTAGEAHSNVDYALTPSAVISGVVTDSSGAPVEQATVQAMQKIYQRGHALLQNRRPIQTNDRGEFRLRDMSAGTYYLKAFKLGYAGSGSPPLSPVLYQNATRMEEARVLRLKAGDDMSGLHFSLADAELHKISGKVMQPNRPLGSRIQIIAAPEDRVTGMLGANALAADDGSFQLNDLVPGAYLLSVSTSLGTFTKRVELSTDITGLTLAVGPGATIRGKVRVEGGELPLKMTAILARNQPVQIGADGSFQMTGVQPGTYDIAIQAFAGSPSPHPFFIAFTGANASDPSPNAATITVPDGASSVDVNATIDFRCGTVSGVAQDAEGKPLDKVNVVLMSADLARRVQDLYFRTAATGANGAFKVPGVVPGEYLAVVWPSEQAGQVQDADIFDSLKKHVTRVTVGSTDVSQDLTLTSAIKKIADSVR